MLDPVPERKPGSVLLWQRKAQPEVTCSTSVHRALPRPPRAQEVWPLSQGSLNYLLSCIRKWQLLSSALAPGLERQTGLKHDRSAFLSEDLLCARHGARPRACPRVLISSPLDRGRGSESWACPVLPGCAEPEFGPRPPELTFSLEGYVAPFQHSQRLTQGLWGSCPESGPGPRLP